MKTRATLSYTVRSRVFITENREVFSERSLARIYLINDVADLFLPTHCPLCRSENFRLQEKRIVGIFKNTSLVCATCGAIFKKAADGKYALTALADKSKPVWQTYADQKLTLREWATIGTGGMSDAKQREADIQLWLEKIRSGNLKIHIEGAKVPFIPEKNEETLCMLPDIAMKEPRAIRKSSGTYGGPSFRIAKGVSIRLGRFGSTSESHQEIRNIDRGNIILTNKKLVFVGVMKTISIDLRKILQIDTFTDGIGIHRTGREKTQYFLWQGNIAKIQFSEGGRQYSEPLDGLIFKCLIEGALRHI